ncbi:hypothetical protein G3O08_04425 [Cryomorpha ignava]|uniref:Uncharacterized protein n=1 Tax=Cryomorpha ignava TaxID=101383 RepID=A0A7K3WNZ7_9FLAO|nr:hypothetical protein [Cryomorpha ignava]NEN22751.1 hypothetical protein [Cryomorpha ignava]
MKNSTRLFTNENPIILTGRKILALFVAVVFFTTSCSQYEIDAPRKSNSDGKMQAAKSMNTTGRIHIESIKYVEEFDYINDISKYDPFIYTETGTKEFDTQTKLANRICHFYDSLGYSVDRIALNDAVTNSQNLTESDLLAAGMQIEEINYNGEMTALFDSSALSLRDFENELNRLKTDFENDNSLSAASILRLNFNYDIAISLVSEGQNNGAILVGDLEDDLPGLHCGFYLAFYAASFIGLCAATGGIGGAAAVVSFAGSIAGVIEGC